MTQSDDHILNFLSQAGLALPPLAIAHNMSEEVSQPTIERRLPKLEKAGLVRRHDSPQGYTEITSLGERYLAGDLSDSEVEAVRRALD
jgi:DNA-binding transcriptional ArsR family regulator